MKKITMPKRWMQYKCGIFAGVFPYAYRYSDDEWRLWTNNPAHLEELARWCLGAARWIRLANTSRHTTRKKKKKKKKTNGARCCGRTRPAPPIHRFSVGELAQLQSQCKEVVA